MFTKDAAEDMEILSGQKERREEGMMLTGARLWPVGCRSPKRICETAPKSDPSDRRSIRVWLRAPGLGPWLGLEPINFGTSTNWGPKKKGTNDSMIVCVCTWLPIWAVAPQAAERPRLAKIVLTWLILQERLAAPQTTNFSWGPNGDGIQLPLYKCALNIWFFS